MEPFLWAALAFFVIAALAGAVFVGVRGWRAWTVFASVAAGAGGGIDGLLWRVERLAAHGERTSARTQELNAALERLSRTQAEAGILLGAVGEVRDVLRAARLFFPQK